MLRIPRVGGAELHIHPKTLTFHALHATTLLTARTKGAARLTASSSDPTVASVSPQTAQTDEATGFTAVFTVTAHAIGNAVVTITDDSGDTESATVNVLAGGWVTLAPLPTPRYSFATAIINDKMYTAGGYGSVTSNALDMYDIGAHLWSSRAPMLNARSGAMFGAIGNTLYVGGGLFLDSQGSMYPLDAFEAYDATSDSWSAKAPLPEKRFVGAAAVVNGVLYVFGGRSASPEQLLSPVLAYDRAGDAWNVISQMPVPRSNIAAASIGEVIYIAGGHDGETYVDTVDAYEPKTNTWRTVAPLPSPRGAAAAAALDGILYVLGGLAINGTYMNVVDAYDPATNAWTTQIPMSTAALDRGVAATRTTLYAVGGWNGEPIADFETFRP